MAKIWLKTNESYSTEYLNNYGTFFVTIQSTINKIVHYFLSLFTTHKQYSR